MTSQNNLTDATNSVENKLKEQSTNTPQMMIDQFELQSKIILCLT